MSEQVWAWAERFSDHVHRIHRARELAAAIYEGETTCGSCSKWMTDACPREIRDQRGTKVGGPSCKALKCNQFVMQQWDAKRIAGLREEYAALSRAGTPTQDQEKD